MDHLPRAVVWGATMPAGSPSTLRGSGTFSKEDAELLPADDGRAFSVAVIAGRAQAMPRRPDALVASWAVLLGAEFEDGTIAERPDEVVMTAVAVFDVDGAVLMPIREEDRPEAVAASDDAARALGVAQERLGARAMR